MCLLRNLHFVWSQRRSCIRRWYVIIKLKRNQFLTYFYNTVCRKMALRSSTCNSHTVTPNTKVHHSNGYMPSPAGNGFGLKNSPVANAANVTLSSYRVSNKKVIYLMFNLQNCLLFNHRNPTIYQPVPVISIFLELRPILPFHYPLPHRHH